MSKSVCRLILCFGSAIYLCIICDIQRTCVSGGRIPGAICKPGSKNQLDCSSHPTIYNKLTWKVCVLINSHILNLSLERRIVSFRPQSSISKSNTSLLNRSFRYRAYRFDHFGLFLTQSFIPVHHTLIIFQFRDLDFVVMPILFLNELWRYGMSIMMVILLFPTVSYF